MIRLAFFLLITVPVDALFELEWADFSTIDPYKEFASSAQHARWLAYLAAKK
jgi:hypothetical protein